MEPQLPIEEALLPRPTVEAGEEEEQQEMGLERRKHPRPTKNNLHTNDSTVSAEPYHAKIITSSSSSSNSSITTNEEFVREEIRINDQLVLVNNGGHPQSNGGHAATAVFEESFHFEDESGTISSLEEHQTIEYSNGVDTFISETTTNPVHKKYDDLAAKKSDTVYCNAEVLVTEKGQMDGDYDDLTAKKVEAQRVVSHHHEEHVEIVEEIDLEETEYNVEEVVEKQNTHDLICPKCSSCITRTVILSRKPKLKKRIRRANIVKPKPTAITATTEAHEQITTEVIASAPQVTTNRDIDSGNREVFRCLSCFSVFTRIGTSIFGRNKAEEVPTSQEATASEDSGTSQIMVNGVKDPSSTVTREYDALISVAEVASSTTSVTVAIGQTEIRIDQKIGANAKDESADTYEPPKFVINSIGNGTENGAVLSRQLQSSVTEPQKVINSVLPTKQIEVEEVKIDIGKTLEDIDETKEENGAVLSRQLQSSVTEPQKVIDSVLPTKQIEVEEVKIDIGKTLEDIDETKEGDGVLVVTTPPPPSDVVLETPRGTRAIDEEQQPLLVREATTSDLDILKSIVYGGLIESITSLGVVSSAVGAGAATLNIFVLALANLIGGLFVLAHNLKELKKGTDETTIQTDMEENRYFKLLGRRGRFPVHATVAVISYIIFGLVAPITYGFSFRVSNDRDYKLASVAAASLFCVLLLALGKAHVKSPPRGYGSYVKTVVEYLVLGVAASGISFLAGELLDKLMEKLGWLDSTSSLASY